MIFKKEHIEQIRNGIKTQTRRLFAGVYKVGHNYSIQPGRGKKGIGMRFVIDKIHLEKCMISKEDAQAEGGYTPEEYEREFKKIYPYWDGAFRWAFKFHIKED